MSDNKQIRQMLQKHVASWKIQNREELVQANDELKNAKKNFYDALAQHAFQLYFASPKDRSSMRPEKVYQFKADMNAAEQKIQELEKAIDDYNRFSEALANTESSIANVVFPFLSEWLKPLEGDEIAH